MAHVLDRRTGSTSPGHALAGIVLRYFFLFKTGSRDRVGSQFSEKFVQENWFRVGAELVPVLKKVSRAGHGALYAIYPPTRHLSSKVRPFIDFLVERFSERTWAAK